MDVTKNIIEMDGANKTLKWTSAIRLPGECRKAECISWTTQKKPHTARGLCLQTMDRFTL